VVSNDEKLLSSGDLQITIEAEEHHFDDLSFLLDEQLHSYHKEKEGLKIPDQQSSVRLFVSIPKV
jgi:hypothetical protein